MLFDLQMLLASWDFHLSWLGFSMHEALSMKVFIDPDSSPGRDSSILKLSSFPAQQPHFSTAIVLLSFSYMKVFSSWFISLS